MGFPHHLLLGWFFYFIKYAFFKISTKFAFLEMVYFSHFYKICKNTLFYFYYPFFKICHFLKNKKIDKIDKIKNTQKKGIFRDTKKGYFGVSHF